MNNRLKYYPYLIFVGLFLILLISSCGNSMRLRQAAETIPPAQQYIGATQTRAVMALTETAAPTLSPTPAPRLKPDTWRLWPVVPEVTKRAKEIYRQGIAMGNNPHAFSKVVDYENVSNTFLEMFDHTERFNPEGRSKPFLDTIENFQGYFDRHGQADQYGYNAASVLSPRSADAEQCLPDENPLECELRLTKPAFVLISLDFWFEGRTNEAYERYLHQIIEYTISKGAVPILTTKADNVEGGHSLNLTTATLAYENDLPLWNFWAATQLLPDHGMEIFPYDGFHLSVRAWEERSYTFLATLDHLWKGLKGLQ